MEKKKLLVSFSGGETSAYMSQWLWNNKQDEYEMVFVFANTGQENEETLQFVKDFSFYHGFPVVWVEALVPQQHGKGTRHKIVNFDSASRLGEPFEDVIKKPGPKPGKPKQYATFYIELDLLGRKPDSKLVNRLLRDHYNNQPPVVQGL